MSRVRFPALKEPGCRGRILLVDDIFTTGSTMRGLKGAGDGRGREIVGAVAAIQRKPNGRGTVFYLFRLPGIEQDFSGIWGIVLLSKNYILKGVRAI